MVVTADQLPPGRPAPPGRVRPGPLHGVPAGVAGEAGGGLTNLFSLAAADCCTLQSEMAHSAALHRLRVVARGPASLLAGVNSVLDRVNRIDPAATVHLSLEPSILSQLCSSSIF